MNDRRMQCGRRLVGGTRRMAMAIGVIVLSAHAALACTSAVLLGSVTDDGRPLLWKNRDTKMRDNEIVYAAPREVDGRQTQGYVAVTNAGEPLPWAGLNASGFAIINTLTLDMRLEGRKYDGDSHAEIMRDALRWCRTVEDFEQMLEDNDGDRVSASTFSVIDAHGRGATFEVGPDQHVMFDAANPEVAAASCAPGVVVRSNFSFTANGFAPGTRPDDEAIESTSYRRFDRAEALLSADRRDSKFDLDYMLTRVLRDHDAAAESPVLLDTRQTISRRTCVCGILIQGVKPGEDPGTATMWVILGEPSLSVAVPSWVAMGTTSTIVDGPETSPLSDVAERLRDQIYVETDEGPRLNVAQLPEIQEKTLAAEQGVVAEVTAALERWRAEGIDVAEMRGLHESACARALETLKKTLEADSKNREHRAD